MQYERVKFHVREIICNSILSPAHTNVSMYSYRKQHTLFCSISVFHITAGLPPTRFTVHLLQVQQKANSVDDVDSDHLAGCTDCSLHYYFIIYFIHQPFSRTFLSFFFLQGFVVLKATQLLIG